MSTEAAIASVTRALKALLDAALDDIVPPPIVTSMTPDVARKSALGPQLNIHLYQTGINAAWRNQIDPKRPSSPPPLPLNLHYLLTAYGEGEADRNAKAHEVLGAAMLALHDAPFITRDRLPDAELGEQLESIRITPLPLTLDELSKLWTIYQTPHRVSAAYEVTVVLIASKKTTPAPLPVVRRGPTDLGPVASAGLPPTLTAITAPNRQPAARLGESVNVRGTGLSPVGWRARVTCLKRGVETLAAVIEGQRQGELAIVLTPDARFGTIAADGTVSGGEPWICSAYMVSLMRWPAANLLIESPHIPSNRLPLVVAPKIERQSAPVVAGPQFEIALACDPPVSSTQSAVLAVGSAHAFTWSPPAGPGPHARLSFTARGVAAGTFTLRLRVDGIDSIPTRSAIGALSAEGFDAAQQIVVR
jgi:hypothetical protein